MLLQKKDNEGFGFVLRGAKGERLFQSSSHISVSKVFWVSLAVYPPFESSNPCYCCTAIPFFFYVYSSDSHRGVHSNASIPRAAVPGVCWWGGRGVESGPEDGGFPHRGNRHFLFKTCEERTAVWNRNRGSYVDVILHNKCNKLQETHYNCLVVVCLLVSKEHIYTCWIQWLDSEESINNKNKV